jgi:hypothetical protein
MCTVGEIAKQLYKEIAVLVEAKKLNKNYVTPLTTLLPVSFARFDFSHHRIKKNSSAFVPVSQ